MALLLQLLQSGALIDVFQSLQEAELGATLGQAVSPLLDLLPGPGLLDVLADGLMQTFDLVTQLGDGLIEGP